MDDNTVITQWRIDDEPVIADRWRAFEHRWISLLVPHDGAMLNALSKAKTLRVRPVGIGVVEFDVRGFSFSKLVEIGNET
jgi:hypothetical protein